MDVVPETSQPATENVPAKPRPTGRAAALFSAWVRDLVISLAISAFIIVFLYQPVKVEGTSMMPTLDDQERIFINKFVYHFSSIDRGDTIVFWFPGDPSKSYIKRVIGVPGDTVEVDRGTVVVNGRALEEDYVPSEFRDDTSMPSKKLPPEDYFVLGDHRSSSNDSRAWGFVPRKYIYGKAVFIYWPFDKMGVLK